MFPKPITNVVVNKPDAPKQEANLQSFQHKQRNKKRCSRFLLYAFTKKYDATASLLGKCVWPFITLVIILLFHSEVKTFVSRVSDSLTKTSKITISGVEVEISQDRLTNKDKGAYAIIGLLDREELQLILELGDSVQLADSHSSNFKRVQPILKKLQEYGLVSIQYPFKSPINDSNTDTSYRLTGLGKRVYNELEELLLGILKELPQNNPNKK